MKSKVLFYIIFFLFLITFLSANLELLKAQAEANVELGVDSWQRRYYKPELKFYFPFKFATFFMRVKYYQRNNSKLKGEIDYWLSAGFEKNLRNGLIIETSLNHMCRHFTSKYNLEIFDLNEVIARLWLNSANKKFAFGFGEYIGGNKHFRNLIIFNSEFLNLFNTELSIRGEFKLVNYKKLLHEIEFSCALNKSMDFFIKNIRTYKYRNITYIGMRINSDGKIDKYIDNLKLITEIYPFYENYKMTIENEFRLIFFKNSTKKMFISAKSFSPILRGNKFLGTFWPDKIIYPLTIEYERKIQSKLFMVGYCKYNINIPLDVDEKFYSDLGIGIGFRNQSDFKKLENKIRFEILGGYNFINDFNFNIKFGMNTLNNFFNIGSELYLKLDGDKSFINIKLFTCFSKEIDFRPFMKIEKSSYFNAPNQSKSKFLFGIEFIKWF